MWSSFWDIPKITSAKLCKSIHDRINYSIYICSLQSGKRAKEGKKSQKSEHLENEKSFLDKIKTFSIVFKGLSLGKKIKKW